MQERTSVTFGEVASPSERKAHPTVEPKESESTGYGGVALTSLAANQAAVSPVGQHTLGGSSESLESEPSQEVEMPRSRFSQQVRAPSRSHATAARSRTSRPVPRRSFLGHGATA